MLIFLPEIYIRGVSKECFDYILVQSKRPAFIIIDTTINTRFIYLFKDLVKDNLSNDKFLCSCRLWFCLINYISHNWNELSFSQHSNSIHVFIALLTLSYLVMIIVYAFLILDLTYKFNDIGISSHGLRIYVIWMIIINFSYIKYVNV